MDQLQQFIQKGQLYSNVLVVGCNVAALAAGWLLYIATDIDTNIIFGIVAIAIVIVSLITNAVVISLFTKPLGMLWQAVLYIAPGTSAVRAPDVSKLGYGHDLVKNLIDHIYQLADVAQHSATYDAPKSDTGAGDFIANSLPLPLMIINKDDTVLHANSAMLSYIGLSGQQLIGQNVYTHFDISFPNDDTLDSWLASAKATSVSDTRTWQGVRLGNPTDTSAKMFDLVAYYNKDNPAGYETMLLCIDRPEEVNANNDAGFVALAVHELRTPLTMLRGYLEALEEDLEGKLSPELTGYIQKMQVSAQQLTAFINNILNVARLNDDQMLLKLHEERWQDVLASCLQDLSLRATIHGITITTHIDPNLPTVGIDRTSVFEVLSNLIDNAIKYSGQGKEIIVTSKLGTSGLVETTVQDFGVGIPTSAMSHIFEKFYRDHHNRSAINGTGLGLYLSQMLIQGHGGTVWVDSKEGKGSTFGFSLIPYAQLAEQQKNSDNKDIVRSSHGWIKNHSLYRG